MKEKKPRDEKQLSIRLRMQDIKDLVFFHLFRERENQAVLLSYILPEMTEEEKRSFQVLPVGEVEGLDARKVLVFKVSQKICFVGETQFLASRVILIELYLWFISWRAHYEMENQMDVDKDFSVNYYVINTGEEEMDKKNISFIGADRDSYESGLKLTAALISRGEDGKKEDNVVKQFLAFCHCLDKAWEEESGQEGDLCAVLKETISGFKERGELWRCLNDHSEELFQALKMGIKDF